MWGGLKKKCFFYPHALSDNNNCENAKESIFSRNFCTPERLSQSEEWEVGQPGDDKFARVGYSNLEAYRGDSMACRQRS